MSKKTKVLYPYFKREKFGRSGAYYSGITLQEIEVRRTASVAERRDWDRLPISIPFFVRGSDADGEELLEFATALNLSARGLLLAGRRCLEPGPPIPLEFLAASVASANKKWD